MAIYKIRKDDLVIVTTGRDKGKKGKVLKVLVEQKKLIVEGINIVKKHAKPNPAKGKSGGIIEKELPIDSSNVGLWNPSTNKPDRVGIKNLEDGKKVRYFKSNKEVIDN